MGKRGWSSLAVAVMLAACGGGDDAAETDEMAQPAAPDTQTMAPPTPAPAGTGAMPADVTPELIAQGKTLFESGVCIACHGPDGSGVANVGPNLRDAEWLNTDGTFDGIMGVIRAGVLTPKQHPAPMPPLGGGTYTDEQVRALAAHIYSISHGG